LIIYNIYLYIKKKKKKKKNLKKKKKKTSKKKNKKNKKKKKKKRNLHNKHYTTSIPESIGNLTELTELYSTNSYIKTIILILYR